MDHGSYVVCDNFNAFFRLEAYFKSCLCWKDSLIMERICEKEYFNICKNLQLEELLGIDLTRLLYLENIYVFNSTFLSIIKRMIKLFFFDCPELYFDVHGKKLLIIDTRYHRPDHDSYWERYIGLFNDFDRIIHDDTYSKKTILKKFRPCSFFRKYVTYKKIYGELFAYKNKSHRKYFSIVLTNICEYKRKIKKMRINPKVVLLFFDANIFENYMVQELRKKGTVSITNQHGQPVFRGIDIDMLNQSQIFNFTSDFFVAKGEFAREQFIKAGVKDSRIRVLGGFEVGKTIQTLSDERLFGVYLDTPGYDFAKTSNAKILQLAQNISEKLNMQYFVKVHPSDDPKNYESYINFKNCQKFVKNEVPLVDLVDSMQFGILHVSSVYVDIVLRNRKAFKMMSDEPFPLVERELDRFSSMEELIDKYSLWCSKSEEEKTEYFDSLRKRYLWSEGFEERIKNFVNSFLI